MLGAPQGARTDAVNREFRMNTALTVLTTFLLGFSAVFFGSEMLARTLPVLGAFYGHLAK